MLLQIWFDRGAVIGFGFRCGIGRGRVVSMTRRRKWLLVAACALVACVVVGVITRGKEPSYGGKRLSEWGAMYDGRAMMKPSAVDKRDADEAIKHIGTNALPYLLRCIDYEMPAWKDTRGPIYSKIPIWMRYSRPVTWLFLNGKASEQARSAMAGFAALGPIGAPAIPQLTPRLTLT